MVFYIAKPNTWFLPFLPVRALVIDTEWAGGFGIFEGLTREPKMLPGGAKHHILPRLDEEQCPLDEFWRIQIGKGDV